LIRLCGNAPPPPPSSNAELSQLDGLDNHNDKQLTHKMLITETHKDVPTQAGGDMRA